MAREDVLLSVGNEAHRIGFSGHSRTPNPPVIYRFFSFFCAIWVPIAATSVPEFSDRHRDIIIEVGPFQIRAGLVTRCYKFKGTIL